MVPHQMEHRDEQARRECKALGERVALLAEKLCTG